MQISPRHGHIVEKIIRDTNGQLVRATFYVYQSGTRVRARLLTSEFIEEVKQIATKVLSLLGFTPASQNTFYSKLAYVTVTRSQKVNQLYSSGSKPRAPTNS